MLSININYVLIITTLLFFIGLLGIILNRKNMILVLMSIEILLLSVNISFAAISVYLDDIIGHIFVLFILTIAAAESAIGLAIISASYKLKGSIEFKYVKKKQSKL